MPRRCSDCGLPLVIGVRCSHRDDYADELIDTSLLPDEPEEGYDEVLHRDDPNDFNPRDPFDVEWDRERAAERGRL